MINRVMGFFVYSGAVFISAFYYTFAWMCNSMQQAPSDTIVYIGRGLGGFPLMTIAFIFAFIIFNDTKIRQEKFGIALDNSFFGSIAFFFWQVATFRVPDGLHETHAIEIFKFGCHTLMWIVGILIILSRLGFIKENRYIPPNDAVFIAITGIIAFFCTQPTVFKMIFT